MSLFRDPLSLDSSCNGENGHVSEDGEDPLSPSNEGGNDQLVKKKRKSSAEKFLEDNSEYYGFQVLPSKLRSSSSVESFPFFDYLRRRQRATSNDHDEPADDDDGQLVSHKHSTNIPYFSSLTIIES